MSEIVRYVDVLLPLRLRGSLSYSVAGEDAAHVGRGMWVSVKVRGRDSLGIVEAVRDSAPAGVDVRRLQPVEEIIAKPAVTEAEIGFWHSIADYYMCSPGEVFKAAYNTQLRNEVTKTPKRKAKAAAPAAGPDYSRLSELSAAQAAALAGVRAAFAARKTAYLRGVTGSGKTEIYMHLAADSLSAGRSVLYLVPEIAISKQLEQRLRTVFGSSLLVFHSGQTVPQRRKVIEAVRNEPFVVLGTRSAIFLPFKDLGLVIVDEEHDRSFKQEEPAPRYNGRDGALMLASRCGASVLLGSATPSFESLLNISTKKYTLIELGCKYHGGADPTIKIIDTSEAWRHREMKGSFSFELIADMRAVLEAGGQVLVFRSRRAYSPIMQCAECGDIPKCPHCNVSLSYHKFNNRLSCHYCGYSVPFTTRCRSCGEPALVDRGAGTEKVEEELQEIFPQYSVSRFDADTAANKKDQEKLIADFAAGKTDIMVGTQMITKGFDFEKLALVVLLSADSLFAVQDFRSDERTVQLVTQLLGRAGRRGEAGRLIIQAGQKDHPSLKIASGGDISGLLNERKIFGYPPFVRMITVYVKDCYEGRMWNVCRRLREEFDAIGLSAATTGPVAPSIEKIGREYISQFWIRLPRNSSLAATKKALSRKIELVESEFKGRTAIYADVDPM